MATSGFRWSNVANDTMGYDTRAWRRGVKEKIDSEHIIPDQPETALHQ
jgi:hypothetical protein